MTHAFNASTTVCRHSTAILVELTKSPVITNDLAGGIDADGMVDESYEEVFKYIYDQGFEIDNIKCIACESDSTSEEESPDEGDST